MGNLQPESQINHQTQRPGEIDRRFASEKAQFRAQIEKMIFELYESPKYVPGKDIKDWRAAEKLIESGLNTSH